MCTPFQTKIIGQKTCENYILFRLVRQNVYPISDQIGLKTCENHTPFQTSQAKCIPNFRPNRPENDTPKGGTYSYDHLRGAPPSPGLTTKESYSISGILCVFKIVFYFVKRFLTHLYKLKVCELGRCVYYTG